MMQIEIANQQSLLAIDESQLQQAARQILESQRFRAAEISIAVVDNTTIHELNQRYLQHDEPTDVLSFVLEQDQAYLAGEVIVSAEMAVQRAPEFGWPAQHELLLYVIHGVLHLVGFDDQTDEARAEMQQAERTCLKTFGLQPSAASEHADGS